SVTILRKNSSSRNLIEFTGQHEPSRREFSSLVATLLPRKTRGNLLQNKKLFQLAIAICDLFNIYKFVSGQQKQISNQFINFALIIKGFFLLTIDIFLN
ncbi:MAG: hypothetical protein IJV39_00325, partial [Ruminococcus sp.]|nr:hypothetical protein [Ruminococcus sp.]